MTLRVDAADPRPIYQQVADGIKSAIARGQLTPGSPLPPVRQLAADLGVNLNTIATAYRQLQDEGLIAIRHGRGAIVAPRRSSKKPAEDLRRPLRTALTSLVLSGLSPALIRSLVSDELNALLKGAR